MRTLMRTSSALTAVIEQSGKKAIGHNGFAFRSLYLVFIPHHLESPTPSAWTASRGACAFLLSKVYNSLLVCLVPTSLAPPRFPLSHRYDLALDFFCQPTPISKRYCLFFSSVKLSKQPRKTYLSLLWRPPLTCTNTCSTAATVFAE